MRSAALESVPPSRCFRRSIRTTLPAEPGPVVTTDRALLDAPLTVALKGGGVLELVGTIDVGSYDRFASEVAARGEYIKVVALNSPGGSVNDAIAIGSLIREKGFATSVATGALCASSCPLVLASGSTRTVEPEAAVGVHQIYARVATGALPTGAKAAGKAMSDAQKTTAVITRHLSAMGVDPALWLHAFETPPTRLYYLSPEEIAEVPADRRAIGQGCVLNAITFVWDKGGRRNQFA